MIVAENVRTAGGLHTSHTDIVLYGNGDAREHTLIPAVLNLLRPPDRLLAIDLEKSIELLIEPLRRLNRKLYRLTRHGYSTTPLQHFRDAEVAAGGVGS